MGTTDGVFLAQMSTPHFEFVAVDRDRTGAMRAILSKLNEVRVAAGLHRVSLREMARDFGPAVQFVPFGMGLRDGEPYFASAGEYDLWLARKAQQPAGEEA